MVPGFQAMRKNMEALRCVSSGSRSTVGETKTANRRPQVLDQ